MEKIIKKEVLTQLLNDKIIEFRPLAYMRGATFDKTMMILVKLVIIKITAGKNVIVMIAELVLKETGGIDHSVAAHKIPVGSNVLGVDQFDHLFGTAT